MDRAEHVAKVLSAVVRDVEAAVRAEDVHAVAVLRIDADLAEVHRPRVERRQLLPAVASINAPVDAVLAARRFDGGVDDAAVAAEDVEADAAFVAARQSGGELRPGGAAVCGPVDAAAGSAAVESPRSALALIHRSEEDVRILRIHDDVGRARVLVDEEAPGPRPPSVRRAEHTPLGVRSPQMTGRGDVDDLRVGGMDDDAADVAGVLEARRGPRASRVGGLVRAVAP